MQILLFGMVERYFDKAVLPTRLAPNKISTLLGKTL
jgi:hypothetical protein